MHRILPAIFTLLAVSGLSAQATLSNAYFPVVGDTLRLVSADSTSAAGVDLLVDGGANLAWDFSGLAAAGTFLQPVAAADNAAFPEADIQIGFDNNVSYYTSSATSFDLVGVDTEFDLFPGLPFSQPIVPNRPIRRAPLEFGASFTVETANSLTISPDSIPAEVLAQIGSALDAADSVRVTTEVTRNDVVDAYGSVQLLDNFYPVLREKRTESVFIRIEIQANGLPFWIDVTGTIVIASPQIAQFVGQQPTTVTYLFWNEDSKEPIADVTTDEASGTVFRFNYKDAQQSTSTQGPGLLPARVMVYPNPATALATFQIEGLAPGNYYLDIVNMVGRRVAERHFSPVGNQTRLTVNVSDLRSGLYLYSVRNEQGRRIVTKRLKVR